MGAHTPGPWSVHKARDIPDSFEIHWEIRSAPELNSSTGWGVVNVHRVLRAGGHAEGEANARLIAAAPELLEALEAAMLLVDMSTSYRRQGIAQQSRAAIAKAKGEEW